MKPEQAYAEAELIRGEKRVKLRCLVDTGASRSVVSRILAEELGSFISLDRPYYLRTAEKEGKVKVSGRCMVNIIFQGIEVPGGVVLEVAENLRDDVELIIGRPEIDSWDIVFTPEGPKPRKAPIEFEII